MRFPILFETLTGQPANPEAQVQAAIAFAQQKHAKRLELRRELQDATHARLAAEVRS